MRPWMIVLIVAVLSVGLGLFSSYSMYGLRAETCEQCGIRINPTFEAILHLKDGTARHYCCVKDALRAYLEIADRVEWVSVTEQETGEKLNVADAIFVENDVVTCKSCGTRLHLFEAERHGGLFFEHRADKYKRKFGGKNVDNPFLAVKQEPRPSGEQSR